MNKQQTAVEWLYNNLKSHFEHDGDLLEVVQFSFEQAKEMEKQQIIDAYWGGLNGFINDYSESKIVGNEMIDIKVGGGAEQYYSKTFNK